MKLLKLIDELQKLALENPVDREVTIYDEYEGAKYRFEKISHNRKYIFLEFRTDL